MGKSIYYIPILLLSMLGIFGSCIQNELEGTDTITGEEAYISMTLSAPSLPMTKAPTEVEIDAWENRVSEIWLLLYNESETLDYKFIWKVQNYADANPSQLINFYDKTSEKVVITNTSSKTSFTGMAQKVKRKQYKMAVLANPHQDIFSNISIGSNLSVLTSVIDGGLQGLDMNKFGSYQDESSTTPFFMSNANGLITITKDRIKQTEQEAETNPVSVKLDRLLAKVAMKEKTGGVTITTANVLLDETRPLTWYTDVINTQTYPIRKFALLAGGSILENENNSVSSGREKLYAEDPNFTQAGNDEEKFFKKWGAGETPPYATWSSENRQDPTLRTYQYTFENTMDLATQSSDNWSKFTTCIIAKIYLIYKNLLDDPNNLNSENDLGRNYYSCLLETDKTTEWKVFTHEQAKHWLETGFPTSADANTAEVLELLEKKIKEVQQKYDGGDTDAFNFKASSSPGTNENNYRTYNGVTYHPLGLNKYCIPIRHFQAASGSSDPRKDTYGYYGVVRNNLYTMTINSISGPGTGIYEWDNRFISAQVNITPWYKRDFQGEDLQ